MTAEELIAQIEALIAVYRVPPIPVVQPGDPLPDGTFKLVAGLEYPRLILRSGQRVLGCGAKINGGAYPAIYVPPSTFDVHVEEVTCASTYQSVVLLGDNLDTTQASAELVPRRITLDRISIPTHRGKRGIEVNASDVTITNSDIADVWSPALADSQAIGVLNSCGGVTIKNCRLSSGSEVVMLGGDRMKIVGGIIRDVLIENCELYRPMSWQTDGINRAVKNLFEIKAGVNVTMRNCVLDGSWKAAQDGWAFVITPKNSQYIENVLVEGCTVRNASGFANLMGLDYNTVTPQNTKGVVFRNCNFVVTKNLGGRGTVGLMTGGMKDVTFENCSGTFDGNAIVQSDSNATYGQHGPLTMTGCTMPTGIYGLTADGAVYGDPLPAGSVYIGQELLTNITGNTFTGAPSRFKTNFPNNTYL